MPKDGNPYKLVGHHHGLVDQVGGVFPDLVEDLVGGAPARSCASLAGHGERVDQGLRGGQVLSLTQFYSNGYLPKMLKSEEGFVVR